MQFGKIAKIVVGTLGLLATAFAVIRGIREYRPPVPKLEAALVNVEHISSRTEIPDVKVSLAFKDRSVSDLWLCRVRFQNVGGVTLHTTGARPNTQNPMVISVPERYEILRIEPKGIDPKDSGFEAQIRLKKDDKGVFDKHQFEVSFEQWRKGEAIEAVLYLAGSGEHMDKPRLIPKGRPILDGDIVPVDFSTATSPEIKGSSTLLDMLAGQYWAPILRMYAIVCMLGVVISLLSKDVSGKTLLGLEWQREHRIGAVILYLVLFVGLYVTLFALM